MPNEQETGTVKASSARPPSWVEIPGLSHCSFLPQDLALWTLFPGLCFHLINSYSPFQSQSKCSFLKAFDFSVRSGPYDKPPHTFYCPLWPVP